MRSCDVLPPARASVCHPWLEYGILTLHDASIYSNLPSATTVGVWWASVALPIASV